MPNLYLPKNLCKLQIQMLTKILLSKEDSCMENFIYYLLLKLIFLRTQQLNKEVQFIPHHKLLLYHIVGSKIINVKEMVDLSKYISFRFLIFKIRYSIRIKL